ncbi:hypothetical protein KQX54_020784 [Cotesia glomerata]|uniref:Uncharacterized protein n=1 Tax=Cotesia glomerata TaxID=32391 RepID=A0AAV7I4Y4_COTGL|nr:hypothetical protein KQX54_020784 [Cotesia glomerata]
MLIRVKCSGLFSAGCKCSDTSHQGLSAYDQSYSRHTRIALVFATTTVDARAPPKCVVRELNIRKSLPRYQQTY